MVHPLFERVEIEGPEGLSIDLCRPRSLGPLSQSERDFLLHEGVSLSFDPVQDGWLPAGSIDDLTCAPDDRPSIDILRARLVPASLARLEALALDLRKRFEQGRLAVNAASEALWKAATIQVQQFGTTFDETTQIEALNVLQRRAIQIINTQFADPADRKPRRNPELDLSRFRLRPWQLEDAPRFVKLLDDVRIWEHLPEEYPNPLTLPLAEDLIAISNETEHHEVRAIELDGALIGQIRLSRQGPHVRPPVDAEVSYWIGVPYWGQGVASSVIPHYTLSCFSRFGLLSIIARVAEGNPGSYRALEKAGYRYLGRYFSELNGEPEIRTYRCYREDVCPEDATPH